MCDGFLDRSDCHIAWVADADIHRAEALAAAVAKRQKGKTPKAVQDFRKVLDDKGVDAVVIATPDHWHAPATIWACQAGKDVYVEKPPTHNCWEGRKMVEAARKYKRIVQVGTQNRSAPYNMAAKKYIQEGKLGKIHFCRVFDQKEWPNFPAVPDSNPPQGFDWDLYNGPAPAGQVQCQLSQQLAPLLAILRRRHRQRLDPPDRPGPLAAGRRLSEVGLFDRRTF